MADLNKEFEYKGRKFNIKLVVTSQERRWGGNTYLKITVNDMGHNNYYKVYTEIEKRQLERQLKAIEQDIMIEVDGIKEQSIYQKLGFK